MGAMARIDNVHAGAGGIGRYGSESDVWALGCMLYELCALRHAFEGSVRRPPILFLQVGVSPVLAIFPRIRTLVDLVRYMAEVRIGATEVFLVCFWIHRQKAHASVFRRARVPRFRERLDFQNRLFLEVL